MRSSSDCRRRVTRRPHEPHCAHTHTWHPQSQLGCRDSRDKGPSFMLLPHPLRAAGLLALAVSVPLIAGCGDDDKGKSAKPATMSITTSDAGAKKFKMTAPSSVEGGLVNVTVHNASKVPHEAQLIKIDGHTAQQALKVVEPDKVVLPDWFFAYGGVATTPPGKSATVTVKLPPGDYAVIDDANDEGPSPSSQGAVAEFKVTGDNDGDIKDTSSK